MRHNFLSEFFFQSKFHVYMFEMWFESIYLYFLEINPHYTQLFSSRETPPASTDVSRFLLQKYSRQLEMNA